jgi:molecular chaperone IbpA
MTKTLFPSLESFRNTFDPFTIGFEDHFEILRDVAEKASKAVTYPPYNIKQISDKKYVIEMAVAGFTKADIEVTLDGNKLVVKGAAKESEQDQYLFKGISERPFTREFKLNDKIEIENAELANGMLKIWLANMVKVQDAVKKIAVKGE